MRVIVCCALIFVLANSHVFAETPAVTHLPFVGCKDDGQLSADPAPTQLTPTPELPASIASDLAFYKSALGFGVVAPRGWYCFGYYGSSGGFLLISPDPRTGQDQQTHIHNFTGPGIEFAGSDSGTSGRFEVAQIAARLFPDYRAFVVDVINEKLVPASDFPFGPYPDDVLTRLSPDDVIFVTSANKDGMGTRAFFSKTNEPITGEAVIGKGGVVVLTVRLPDKQQFLMPSILSASRLRPSDLLGD